MTQFDLLQKLLEIARDVLDEEDIEFDASTPFDQIEAWDSLNHLQMVIRMEKDFGIRFDLSSLQRVTRVGELLDIVARLQRT